MTLTCRARVDAARTPIIIAMLMSAFAFNAIAGEVAETHTGSAGEKADPTFDLNELRVLGNTVLDTASIEKVVYPFLGESKSFADVENARAALETLYHDRGYGTVFVDVPEQTVDADGVVRLHVMEARLNKVTVVGARYFSGRQIRAALASAVPNTVPHLPTLQSELTKVNTETSDRVVTPVLKAGPRPGTVDLALRVDDHLPFHGSVELNNQYTQHTKPLRLLGSLSYDNLFATFDSLSVQYQTSPQDWSEVDVFTSSYIAKFEKWRGAAYYLHSNSQVSTLNSGSTSAAATSGAATGGPTDLLILGKGSIYGLRLILPVVADTSSTHNVTLGVEYKDFLESIDATTPTTGAGSVPTSPHEPLNTPISYVNWSASYGGFWRGARQQVGLDTSANFGIRAIENGAQEFDNKRFRARPNYLYLRSAASYGVHFPFDFTGVLRVAGQYAAEPIISNEQFSIAGADGVRGYLEAEELADKGIKTTVQLGSPQWHLFAKRVLADAFVFYDYGKIGVIEALPGEPSTTSLRSWGAGLDLVTYDHLSGSVTWAYPLTDGSSTRSGDSRVLLSVRGWW
jgi:hemolysin activation/secretion protein